MAEQSGTYADARSTYEADGFVVLRSFFSPDEVAEIRAAIERYIAQVVPHLSGSDVVREDDGTAVRNLFRMEAHEEYFNRLGRDRRLTELVAAVLDDEPVLRAVQTFNKPARVGSAVPQHQDNAYFCYDPPRALTVWIAIDPATTENGPVHYIRGTHTLGSLPHKFSGRVGNSLMMAEPYQARPDQVHCATMNPGDIILHHCRTVHFSARNTSDNPRLGMVLPYSAPNLGEDPALKAFYKEVSAEVGSALRH